MYKILLIIARTARDFENYDARRSVKAGEADVTQPIFSQTVKEEAKGKFVRVFPKWSAFMPEISACPSDVQLRALVTGQASASQLDELLHHLDSCPGCLARTGFDEFGNEACRKEAN